MNTPAQPDRDLRCAEYALGVLDADARREVERACRDDPALQLTLERWQRHFAMLAEDLAPREVPRRVWLRIQRDLGFLPERAPRGAASGGWWNNLTLWRWAGLGASAAALSLLAVDLVTQHPAQPPAAVLASNYMVATIARPDGVAHWTATVDLQHANLVVVPADKPVIAANRSTELWLIPPHAKPIPLGVFAANQPASVSLRPDILAQVDAHAVLAVSIEPLGGSPTGQPTGPVVATGAIHPA
jgi:anti-sigma-K factor RskA